VDVGDGRAIDQQAEQLGATMEATRVHQPFALVDHREIEIGNHHSLARAQRFTHQFALWRDDGGEASAGDRLDGAPGVLHDLALLIGVEPGGGADDEARGFQGVLADVDLGLLGEELAAERTGYIAE